MNDTFQMTDTIKLYGELLYVQFGSSGINKMLHAIDLGQGVTFLKDNKVIKAVCHASKLVVPIDEFGDANMQSLAINKLQNALVVYLRRSRVKTIARRFSIWFVLPLCIFMLAAAFNASLNKQSSNEQLATMPAAQNPNARIVPPPIPPASEVAKLLKDGVDQKQFAVALSNNGRKKVYVFSDPLCSHCKKGEPLLDELAKRYEVHVFPVSVIGQNASAAVAATVLCANEDQRRGLWADLMSGQSINGKPCDAGSNAVALNNQVYIATQIQGTPTIIAENGERVPIEIQEDVTATQEWLDKR